MAKEEIKLVGSFDDQITKKLQKLNREITNIGRSFERMNKKLAPVTKSFAKMAMSARTFSDAMKSQRNSIDASARSMREYSRQAGKMSGALRKVTDQRIKAQRQMGVSRAQMRKGGGKGDAMGPAPGAGGGAAYGAAAAKGFNSGIGSVAIGSTIGNLASQAIMSGVRGIGNLLSTPFNKFAAAFQERIGDEMDDIKSAGGLFALDMDLTQQSGNERFFKNYNEALRYQEKLNIDMAESAAALPGVTSQYVSTSRQLTDTIQMVMEKDRESFNKMAARYGADISQGGVDASKSALQTILKKQTEQVVLQSQGQMGGLPMHIAIQQLLGKEAKNGKIGIQGFTNKFRAAFQKNPLLKNFLLRAEEDLAKTDAGSVERLQKIIEVFDAAMPKEVINKMRGSLSGMMEALRSGLLDPQAGLFGMSRAVFASAGVDAQFVDKQGKLLKKNVNDFGEYIYKFSEDFEDTAGITKELGLQNTTNLKGQELTLEQLKKLKLDIDKNGRIIDAQGKVYGEISKSNTYLFEVIREILAGFGPVLLELVGFLPMLFDPFTKMTESLMPLRDQAQEFISGFNKNIDVFEKIAQDMAGSADAAEAGRGNVLKSQSRGRAAISKITRFLEGVGGIDKELSGKIMKTVGDVSAGGIANYDKNISSFIEPLFRQLIESDLAKSLSKGFGQIVGGIIRVVYDMITGIFSLAEGGAANALVDGFKEGFGSAFADIEGGMGGMMSKLTDILTMVLVKIGEILVKDVIPAMVKQVINMIMSGFSKGPIGILISGGLILALVSGVKLVIKTMANLAINARMAAMSLGSIAKSPLVRGSVKQSAGAMKNIGATAKATKLGGKAAKALAPLSKIGKGVKGKAVGAMAAGVVKMATVTPALKGMGKAMMGLGKSIPLLNVAFAGLDFAAEKAAGSTTAAAAGSAGGGLIGSVIGGALGTFLGPIGTLVGSMIGGWLGSEIGKAIANMDFSWVADAWNAFTGFLSDAWQKVSSGASDAWNNLTETIGPLWEGFTSALGNAWESVSTGAGNIWNNVTGTIGGVWNSFTDSLGNAWNAVSNAGAEFLDDPFYFIGKAIREGFLAYQSFVSGIGNKIVEGITTAVDFIKTGIVTYFTVILPGIFSTISGVISTAFDALVTYFTVILPGIFAAIPGVLSAAFDAVVSFFTTTLPAIFSSIGQILSQVFEQIKSTISSMVEGIKGAISGFVASVASLPGQIASGLESVTSAIMNWVQSLPGKVAGGIGGAIQSLGAGLMGKGKPSYKGNFPRARNAASGQGNGFTMGELAEASSEAASAELAFASASIKAAGVVKKSGGAVSKAITAISGNWMTVNSSAAAGLSAAAQGMGSAISTAAGKLSSAASAISGNASSDGDTKAGVAYNGLMNLNDAIATEMKYKPPGSDLVIANSSETIIPAYKGNFPNDGEIYKGLDFGTMEMASGFDRMKSHTEQLSEIADKTSATFTGGFGGALGGGSATLQAMEALGHQHGLITTSGFRPGDPGFHGANRARDLSNGGGETPEMNKVASIMASQFGSSLTELIYTPMGFSIKNGAKTGLISPDNHYHHIHVAVAEGLAKAAMFSSERAALQYEKANMPGGASPMKVDLSSMTANSSEFVGGRGDITVGDVNVSVQGVDDPRAIANVVAEEILDAVQRATYTELFTV